MTGLEDTGAGEPRELEVLDAADTGFGVFLEVVDTACASLWSLGNEVYQFPTSWDVVSFVACVMRGFPVPLNIP